MTSRQEKAKQTESQWALHPVRELRSHSDAPNSERPGPRASAQRGGGDRSLRSALCLQDTRCCPGPRALGLRLLAPSRALLWRTSSPHCPRVYPTPTGTHTPATTAYLGRPAIHLSLRLMTHAAQTVHRLPHVRCAAWQSHVTRGLRSSSLP